MPDYLARHYWWAYLWSPGVWFFNHQPIINAILFGQYKRLLNRTLHYLEGLSPGNFLQLTCVYGQLSPKIIQANSACPFFLCDIAQVQLDATKHKIEKIPHNAVYLSRMNVENIAFKNDSFDTVLVFFLLHELPHDARNRTLEEVTRVLAPGGRLIIVEYAPLPTHHFLYRIYPLRWIITQLEPFLDDFWKLPLSDTLNAKAQQWGKKLERLNVDYFFNRFYRIEVYKAD